MDKAQVNQMVKRIEELARDFEAAHSREDDLYIEVLSAIAQGADNAQELAQAALETQKLHFDRYAA